MKLAKLQEEAGMPKDAIKTLERLIYIYPMGEELHRQLGDLYFAQNSPEGAVREYSAVIAAKPIDAAASHFNLARALQSAKRLDDAKEHCCSRSKPRPDSSRRRRCCSNFHAEEPAEEQ